jgi:hypothetical protein
VRISQEVQMQDGLIARSMGINKKLDEFRFVFFLPYPSAMQEVMPLEDFLT